MDEISTSAAETVGTGERGADSAPRPRRCGLGWPWAALGAATAVAQLSLVAVACIALLGRSEATSPLVAVAARAAEDGQAGTDSADRLQLSLERLQPTSSYIVIDTYRNRLRVCEDGVVQREAVCSTGTGIVLRDPRGSRTWVFDSPVGERRVQRKVRDPVWSKPDWAFIEEGFIPPTDPAERVDTFSLGDYALYLGDGFIIHGTIFQTLLGQSATHGCIRLGDEDLRHVYQTVPVGARVYLY